MKIIVKYESRASGSRQLRKQVIPLRKTSFGAWNWHEFVSIALFHKQEGERIVAIVEEGYDG